jgi:hypothetical protein
VNPAPLHSDPVYSDIDVTYGFGNQHPYFHEELNPCFPKLILKEMDLNAFIDVNHAHDKVSGCSIIGLLTCNYWFRHSK